MDNQTEEQMTNRIHKYFSSIKEFIQDKFIFVIPFPILNSYLKSSEKNSFDIYIQKDKTTTFRFSSLESKVDTEI